MLAALGRSCPRGRPEGMVTFEDSSRGPLAFNLGISKRVLWMHRAASRAVAGHPWMEQYHIGGESNQIFSFAKEW